VLIEASPQNFQMLKATTRNWQTHKEHSAVCNVAGTVEVMGGGDTVAGVASDFAHSFARHWRTAHEHCGDLPCVANVSCRPLPMIIADAGFPSATFLSLDVEGGEERVLQSVSTREDAFPFDVVMVEADRGSIIKNARVQQMLTSKWGLVQHPIEQSKGSTNQLYARQTIRDVRPNATTRAALYAKADSVEVKETLLRHLGSLQLSPFVNVTLTRTPTLLVHRLIEGLPSEMEALLEHLTSS